MAPDDAGLRAWWEKNYTSDLCQHGARCKRGTMCQAGRRKQSFKFVHGNVLLVWALLEGGGGDGSRFSGSLHRVCERVRFSFVVFLLVSCRWDTRCQMVMM